MATEGSGFNPIAVLVHLVAIALGLYLGWIAMDRDLARPSRRRRSSRG